MNAVYAAVMYGVGGVSADEIHVLIKFACQFHHAVGHFHLGCFNLLCPLVEVPFFAVDCLLEYERNSRMCGLKLFDEREQTFLYHCCIRV